MSNHGAVQIQVTVNGHSITIEKKNLISLQVKRTMGDAANEFTLEAFDETAWQLENSLMGSDYAPISVAYSSAASINQNKTIIFAGTCFNYEVTFAGMSTMITITGILAASSDYSSSASWWFDRNSIEWCGSVPEQRNGTWYVDGKSEAEYLNYENNEDVCAILDFKNTLGEEQLMPTVYFNPSRIFKRIIHKYNGDKLGSSSVNQITTTTIRGMDGSLIDSNPANWGIEINNTSDTCWNYLTNTAGYSPYVAAGIMGNMMQESSMIWNKYDEMGGDSYGLIQWRKLYYPQLYGASLSKQLEFIKPWINDSYNTYKGNYNSNVDLNDFLAMTNEQDVAEAFCLVMERPSRKYAELEKRKKYAKYYLYQYSNSSNYVTSITSDEVEGWGTGGTGKFKLGTVDDSRWIANLETKQTNETAAEYITRVLCKNAISDTGKAYQDEVAGFKYYVDAKGHHFKALDYNAGVKAPKITIQYGMQNASIISFSIAKVGAIAMVGGMYDKNGNMVADVSSLDSLYGVNIRAGGETVLDAEVTDEEIKNQTEYANWYFASVSGIKVVSSSSQTGLDATLSSKFSDMSQWPISAELTLWGEYSKGYAPGDYLDIVVMGADGVKHYASGVYMILEMTDNVSSEGYIQSLRLFKMSKDVIIGTANSANDYSATTIVGSDGNEYDGTGPESGITSLTPSYELGSTTTINPFDTEAIRDIINDKNSTIPIYKDRNNQSSSNDKPWWANPYR